MSDDKQTTDARPNPEGVASAIIPEHIRRLIGEPPLLKGESVDDYNALLEQLVVDANPRDFTSWLLIAERAQKLWEYARLQRLGRALVDEEFNVAAKDVLGDLKRLSDKVFTPKQKERGASSVAIGLLRGDAEDTAAITQQLANWGLSVDTLHALAMKRCQKQYLTLRDMSDRVRSQLRLIERDRERHRYALTERAPPAAAGVVDVEMREAA